MITRRAATRASPLAVWQTEHVISLLQAVHPGLEVEQVRRTTAPDKDLSRSISDIGGKGSFAKEVQAAVLAGEADFAVHSAKDLPSVTVDGLVMAAVPERGDPRDVLVGARLIDLPVGATVATGSNRRRTQLQSLRPDLHFVELRGNMQRRVSRVGTEAADGSVITAVIAAGAALLRQDMEDAIADWLPTYVMTPQVGQGALAVECRVDDTETLELLRAIEHRPSRRLVDAERSFLIALGGDCDLPAGAHATFADPDAPDGEIVLQMVVADFAGTRVERAVVRGTDEHALGAEGLRLLPTP